MLTREKNHPAPVVIGRGIKKWYGSLEAVKGIDFAIERGECFGFVGPNGAGKTTTMKTIYGSARYDAGSLTVLGREVAQHTRWIKSRIGVTPQEDGLDRDLTVALNLIVYASYFGIPKKEREERAEQLLRYVELTAKRDALIEELSGGMRRRLTLARSLINNPEILILDEPTTGLDPQARRLVWDNLLQMKRQQKTMLLTTHYMEEASYLCDRVAIMNEGKIIALDSPQQLIATHIGHEVLEVAIGRGEEAAALQALLPERIGQRRFRDRLYLYLREPAAAKILLDRLAGRDVVLRRATLEDVFLHLTGYELREGI